MSTSLLASQLFLSPGAPLEQTRHLLAQAAGAHARLLASAAGSADRRLAATGDTITAFLPSRSSAAAKVRLLNDPQLVEGLHAAAGGSPRLQEWDAALAPGCYDVSPAERLPLGRARLGNVAAAVSLRRWPELCGTLEVATDNY